MGEISAPLAPAQVREWIVLEAGNIQCGIAITQIQEINKHIEHDPCTPRSSLCQRRRQLARPNRHRR